MSRSRMFRDDQPENPSPRTTIVGGRPPDDTSNLPPVPTGLQTLLRIAALDVAFRAELLARRGAVAGAAGVALTRSEEAILAAVPDVQLERMIETLPPPPSDRRTFLRNVAASAVVLLGGAAVADTLGCQRADHRAMASEGGAAPDEPPERPRANDELVKGIRPEPEPPRVDVRESATGGGAAPDQPPPRPLVRDMEREGGAAPEPPPPRPTVRDMETDGGAKPDEPPPRPDHGFPAPGGAAPDLPRPQPTRGIRPDLPPPRPDVQTGGEPDPFPGSR